MTRKPSVLLVAFFFPPVRVIASVRAWNMACELARLGWQVTVLTPKPSLFADVDDSAEFQQTMRELGIRVIHTSHGMRHMWWGLKDFQRKPSLLGRIKLKVLWRFARHVFYNADEHWLRPALRASWRLRGSDVDVILATGGHWSGFFVGEKLAARLSCPYVLDYRDLWTEGNPHSDVLDRERAVANEARLLAGAAAVTTVSPSCAVAIEEAFDLPKPVHVITNGYNPCDVGSVRAVETCASSIVYAGLFAPPKRDAGPIFAALKRIADRRPDQNWSFDYYGPDNEHVAATAETCGLAERTVLHGRVSRCTVLEAIKASALTAVVVSAEEQCDLGVKGIVTGKLFEPIGLRRPYLVIAPLGCDIYSFVQKAGGGAVFPASDVEGMESYVLAVMQGQCPAWNDPDSFSWPAIATQLNEVLTSVRAHRR